MFGALCQYDNLFAYLQDDYGYAYQQKKYLLKVIIIAVFNIIRLIFRKRCDIMGA